MEREKEEGDIAVDKERNGDIDSDREIRDTQREVVKDRKKEKRQQIKVKKGKRKIQRGGLTNSETKWKSLQDNKMHREWERKGGSHGETRKGTERTILT